MPSPSSREAVRPLLLACTIAAAACGPPPPEPDPPGTIAFGVFGDGPYYPWEQGRFRRLLDDVGRSRVEWLIHVGDILERPCSDDAFQGRFDQLNSVSYPVVYTPGDNEWTDCRGRRPGGYDPLDRLASIRRIFFRDPHHSLGNPPMPLETQSDDSAFAEFVENTRWTRGGFIFSTLHLVGSNNGLAPFPGRTPASDREVARRTEAAIDWLDKAFEIAQQTSARGVVLAMHADMGLDREDGPGSGFEPFIERLKDHVATFDGLVLLLHGDSHELRADQPLADEDGRVYENLTRFETFGSPDIGWLRIVVDTVRGEVAAFEPRRLRGWW